MWKWENVKMQHIQLFTYLHISTLLIIKLSTVRIIHPNPSPPVIFPVNGADHLGSGLPVYFHPAVHFLHVDPAQHIFFQIAHIQDKLQETCLIKPSLVPRFTKSLTKSPLPGE